MNDDDLFARIRARRLALGMSQKVFADRMGKSLGWARKLEAGGLQVPKLHMLARIAKVLECRDLAELTGDTLAVDLERFAAVAAHSSLPVVRHALLTARVDTPTHAVNLDHLRERVRMAWKVRHESPDHRSQLAARLPGLIRDAQRAVRQRTGAERREARRVLADVYRLTDFYVAWQPDPGLLWLVVDRAVAEGQETDDPVAIAGGSWALVQALRETGSWDQALDVGAHALTLLEPRIETANTEWRAMIGAMRAEQALTYARKGRYGDAWRYWESAQDVIVKLPAGYRHVQSSFSVPVMQANAVTLGVELCRPGEALRAANFDPASIGSRPRRARHLIEVARIHDQLGDDAATLATLQSAVNTAHETARFNGWARQLALKLRDKPPSGQRDAARELAARVGVH
ncbi:helix-turn-helix transcriptional regulator [Saccharopolyspora thermophila]|uniref:HTH cro/C1-type domain-containing protein n=1 Tax=Saccharopolyspora thermophila TaxID=89367 RepID=A0ABN1BWU8_9PSEU